MREAKNGGTMLHYCQQMMAGEVPGPPVAQLIGMELAAVRPGQVAIELEAGKQHTSPLGTVHGGILCAIADAATGSPEICGRLSAFPTMVVFERGWLAGGSIVWWRRKKI